MPLTNFANVPSTNVISGGTTAPSSGTSETWTVNSSTTFPTASNTGSPTTQFHVADITAGYQTEIIAVTNVSGNTWTVTRGAEGSATIAHQGGFTISQVVSAGDLGSFPQWYSVRAYGATGNGTTDDTTAIQNTVNAAVNDGVGVVYIPAGTYKISSTLNFTATGLTVIGAGSQVVTISQATSNIVAVNSGGQYQNISGMTITYATPQTSGQTGAIAFSMGSGTTYGFMSKFHDLVLKNCQTGIACDPANNNSVFAFSCNFENIYVASWTFSAIVTTSLSGGQSTGCAFTNIYCNNGNGTSASYVFYFKGFTEAVFNQLNIEAASLSTDAIRVEYCNSIVFNSVHFESLTFTTSHTGFFAMAGTQVMNIVVNSAAIFLCTINSSVVTSAVYFAGAGWGMAAVFNGFAVDQLTVNGSLYVADFGSVGESRVWVRGANVDYTIGGIFTGVSTGGTGGTGGHDNFVELETPSNVFNVLSFGAVGDNFTDSTAYINAAITAAINNGGGIVYLPRGTYVISTPLLNSQSYSSSIGVRIVGDGPSITHIQMASGWSGTAAIEITGGYFNSVEQLTIVGPSSYNTGGGITVAHSNNFNADNVTTTGLNGTSLTVTSDATGDCNAPVITNYSTFSDLGGISLIGTTSTDRQMGAFLNNIFLNGTGVDGLYLLDIYDVQVIGMQGSNCGGWTANTGSNIHISGLGGVYSFISCDFGANSAAQASLLVTDSGLGSPSVVEFIASCIQQGPNAVLMSGGASDFTFNSCLMQEATHTGVSVSGTVTSVTFNACTFTGNNSSGTASQYDLAWSSTGTLNCVGCNWFSTIGASTFQVANHMNPTSGVVSVSNSAVFEGNMYTSFPAFTGGKATAIGSAVTGTSGTSAQNITNLVSPYLVQGDYTIRVDLTYIPTGTIGSTTTFGFSAGSGLALSAISMTSFIQSGSTTAELATSVNVTSTTLSDAMWTSPTHAASTGLCRASFWGTFTVSTAGTLQMVFANTTSADTCNIVAGSMMEITPRY